METVEGDWQEMLAVFSVSYLRNSELEHWKGASDDGKACS